MNLVVTYIVIIIIGYLIGNISPSVIITRKVKGIDIRDVNTKNAGTSNAVITLGVKWGAVVAITDILKSLLPVLVIKYLFPENDILWIVGGVSVIIGHVYPIFLGFKGGKGTATFGGMVLAISPISGIILLILFIVITLISDFVTIPTILSVIVVPIGMYFFNYHFVSIIIVSLYSVLSIYKHFPNLVQMYKKEAIGLREVFK